MSKNYDNWDRLVTAVLRRERDKQIALSHSRDPSSISSTSSSFNLRQRSQLPMDYSDLTLDHLEWKTMLPPNKQEVVWRSASLSFFLDKMTGKNCFLLGATNLIMSSGDHLGHFWETKSHPKSRFSEVAELIDSWELYVEGRIKTKMLSPETLYAAYLVFALIENYAKPHTATSIIGIFYDESDYDSKKQDRIVHFETGNGRADGWMEIELGDFYVGLGDNGEIQVQLLETSGYEKSGLIIEGIEFRPLEGKKNRRGKGIFSNLRNS
ncbi:hypothetical protein Pfo_026616 [Paulownia fortunei]|nr:hypothetical protein Pfo_026616 [Paulownia fortunei]